MVFDCVLVLLFDCVCDCVEPVAILGLFNVYFQLGWRVDLVLFRYCLLCIYFVLVASGFLLVDCLTFDMIG